MAVWKVHDGLKTHYIFRPEDIVEIRDIAKGVRVRLPAAQGEFGGHHAISIVTEKNARDVKREVQEQHDEPIGYLKMTDERYVENGRRYINAKYVVSAHPAKVGTRIDGKYVTVDGAFVSIDHFYDDSGHESSLPGLHVALDPFEVARQIRRILRRLEQDEEICCAAAPEDEEETE